jgi:acetoacetate decarboxylase
MVKKQRKFFFCFLAFLLLASVLPGFAQEAGKDFCMPGFSPLYGPPPVRFQGNRIFSVIFKTSPEVLQRLLPKPLLPNPFNLMFVYIGRLHIQGASGGYDYLEAGIGIPAVFGGMPGNYAVCLYLDKVMPIVGGREVWGWPKKEAEIAFVEKDGEISGRVERFGTVVLGLSGKLEKKAGPGPAQPELPWFLQKIIPSVKKGAPPDVWQLTSTRNADVVTRELWNCTATVKLGTGPWDLLGDIPVTEIAGAFFSVGDFTMDYGDVLHDYLAPGSQK